MFAGLNPAKGDGFLSLITIRRTSSFGGEVKPSAPCRKILRHEKNHFEYEQRYFEGQIHNFLRPFFLLATRWLLVGLPELWWTNQGFSSVDVIPQRFPMLIYHLGD
jgi:hypothetical protein